tara:strand:- start:132 stop:644 length:513 start_codon:yes stop_codon:yes gene_type:complete
VATSLETRLALKLKTIYRSTGVDLSTPYDETTVEKSVTLTDGNGADKAECVWTDTITASDAGTTIDVFGGITDVFGNTLSMAQIKCVYIENKSTTTGEYIDVFGAAQAVEIISGSTDTVRIHPEGFILYWASGAAADSPSPTAGVNDEILITAASAKTPEVDIVIIGENA